MGQGLRLGGCHLWSNSRVVANVGWVLFFPRE